MSLKEAIRVDSLGIDANKTEELYKAILKVEPTIQAYSAYICFLIIQARTGAAKQAYENALKEVFININRYSFYCPAFHLEILKTLLCRAEIRWAGEIIKNMPVSALSMSEVMGINRQYKLFRQCEKFDTCIFPYHVDVDEVLEVPQFKHSTDSIVQHYPCRIDHIEDGKIEIIYSTGKNLEQNLYLTHMSFEAFDKICPDVKSGDLKDLPIFGELAKFENGDGSLRIYQKSEAVNLEPALDSNRYIRNM